MQVSPSLYLELWVLGCEYSLNDPQASQNFIATRLRHVDTVARKEHRATPNSRCRPLWLCVQHAEPVPCQAKSVTPIVSSSRRICRRHRIFTAYEKDPKIVIAKP